MQILIPMAGRGSRFEKENYTLPKPLIPVNGKPMIFRAIESLGIYGSYYFIIRSGQFEDLIKTTLKECCEFSTIIDIDYVTEGAACSALLCRDHIDLEDELLMVNCDQIMHWNPDVALAELRKHDGSVVTIKSTDPKHSFIKLDSNGMAIELAEKTLISDDALTGIHYWKKAKYFVDSADQMIEDNFRVNGEFYVAPTYNYMIKSGLKVGSYKLNNTEFYPVGTPYDLNFYLNGNK
jgi:NDP-sugar pyrophosphorylase family protein